MSSIVSTQYDDLADKVEYIGGVPYWKYTFSTPKKSHIKGEEAGNVRLDGYRLICLNGKSVLSSRLHYYIQHGWLPEFVDHIDRDRSNDLLNNLRAVTRAQNSRNRTKSKGTTSIYKGVTLRQDGKWRCRLTINSKVINLGSFATEREAAIVYNEAAKKYHGEFACLNVIKEEK